jgi:hypothetical protein
MLTSGISLPKESFTKPNILAFFCANTEDNNEKKITNSVTILLLCNKVDLIAVNDL